MLMHIFCIVFPTETLYSFIERMPSVEERVTDTHIDFKSKKIIEHLQCICIASIKHKEISSPEEFHLIKEAISSANSKIYLKRVEINLKNFDSVIEILDLLSDCKLIEYVNLEYWNVSWKEISKGKEILIKETTDSFFKKLGRKIYVAIKNIPHLK